ncbi:MAG TPA: AraC family transcriptional regulator [Kofleriaceae bacterium]|nr:AraC family transcriptional regulator [Kofleriaceae bacterium]
MEVRELRRSWSGLEVALIATRAGVTRTLPSRDHRLVCHVGPPARATCRTDNRTHHRLQSRGDLDLIPAGIPGIWEDDDASTVLLIEISPELLAAAAARAGLSADAGPEPIELAPQLQLRDPRLEHLAWAFEAELRAEGAGDPLYGESLGMAIAAHLVRRYRASASCAREPEGGLSPRQLKRVVEHIEAHVDRRLALAELAAVAGVSASHFKALFKRSTGLPVHQYVVRRRVERARLLLQEKAATIADVAAQTGFANQSHLARWMRRVAGVTPTDVLRADR